MIIGCLNGILLVIASGLLIICSVLFIESIAAFLPIDKGINKQPKQDKNQDKDIKFNVLIPAHNEEVVIRSTLENLIAKLDNLQNIVVVADNCTDATAEIARSTEVQVIERHEPNLRGKGYALDYGLNYLKSQPPSVVVFVDADCQVSQGTIERITYKAAFNGRPVQATYLMSKSDNSNPKASVSAFAFKVKNLVRPYGLSRLGQPCLLTGTGMAFPWKVINSVDIASSNIVEDMKLGFDLSLAGYPPMFCPQSKVIGYLPLEVQTAKQQRTRWEHGHLQTLLTYVPLLLKAAVKQKRFDLFVSAIDLCIPPLSLLVIAWLGITSFTFVTGLLLAIWTPAIILSFAGILLLVAILSAWAKFGRSDLPIQQLLMIPIYILWKIPLYLQFLVKRQKTWIRTTRDSVNL
ncbi:glycosyltransferase family 2 protein [Plectonema cf. radiosum LEGE 06105]|uniref:Glycosyltransferase family 2 protein n=1 Tax=Plectonema cf. radiosum LEGE 06105 TaxID=945769 RepID=A0A8J7F3G6_9CYAN|nr:glycosyltransferase family 2 protein [Plectonema radiosum]MBE9213303.1 glycosyltransferase family 2 protein [Plectonema cf. radiosum LEGE 06105]